MRALLSLGSNQGDRVGYLVAAREEISGLCHVEKVSSLYETEALGGEADASFINAAMLVTFDAHPDDFLEQLLTIETMHGRTREVRWGNRTLDIDIVDVEGFTGTTLVAEIPHPRAHERNFVVLPCREIAPEWILTDNMPSAGAVEHVEDPRWTA